jgi:nitroreductase
VRTAARYGEEGRAYARLDVAAAIENMLIAATSLGLGAAWIGGFRQAEAAKSLRLDRDLEPLGLLALGYAREEPPVPYRLPLSDILTEV